MRLGLTCRHATSIGRRRCRSVVAGDARHAAGTASDPRPLFYPQQRLQPVRVGHGQAGGGGVEDHPAFGWRLPRNVRRSAHRIVQRLQRARRSCCSRRAGCHASAIKTGRCSCPVLLPGVLAQGRRRSARCGGASAAPPQVAGAIWRGAARRPQRSASAATRASKVALGGNRERQPVRRMVQPRHALNVNGGWSLLSRQRISNARKRRAG